ncbi:MAG: NAD-dependent epimerase/dehydratase family protein [Candidatus Margulisiibacteriota bacterium]
MTRVLVLGATGFLGRHLCTAIQNIPSFHLIAPTKQTLNLLDEATWHNVEADAIINAAAYGVVHHQHDTDVLLQTNYLQARRFFEIQAPKKPFWIQLGTAFEYDVDQPKLTEASPCLPKTPYGISKWLMSHYLGQQDLNPNYVIVRPFALFGPGEDTSKLVPSLILSQLQQQPVSLSNGQQQRDYAYIKDVARWLIHLVRLYLDRTPLPHIVNVGSGNTLSLRDFAETIHPFLPEFNAEFWQWDTLSTDKRPVRSLCNASSLATELGFSQTDWPTAIQETITAYQRSSHCVI